METRELKDKASQLFAKGKFAKAAEIYEEYCAIEKSDHQAWVRGGDAWAKAGRKDRAIIAYSMAAEGFAKDGFLPRAIAAGKLVLALDPVHTDVQQMLARLYAQRSGGVSPDRTAAPRPSVSAEPGGAATPAAAGEMEISRNIEPPNTSNFGNRTDALELPDYEISVGAVEHLPAELQVAEAPGPKVTNAPASSAPSPQSFELVVEVSPSGASPAPSGVFELTEALPDAPSAPRPAPSGVYELTEALPNAASPSALRPGPSGVFDLTEIVEPPGEPRLGGLPEIPLFSDLPEDAFIALFEKCPLQHCESGQLIFAQGATADALYVICEGSVRVFRIVGGTRKNLATLTEGSFFGEMALLSEAPRTASVEAASDDTQLLVISAKVLQELSARYPSVTVALRKFCRQRMLSNLLNQAPLFAAFDRKHRRELLGKFRAREANKGDILLREGQLSDGLYLVASGEVEVEARGNRVTTLKEGQIFGERSLLMRSPATATVRALRASSLLRLPKQDFDVLILSHPQVLEHVSELIDARSSDSGAFESI